MATKTYILEHLGCADCASKIERKIAALPGVSEAAIVYTTRQLRLNAEDPDGLLPEIQKIAVSYEPDILITERKRRSLKKAPVAAGRAPHDHKEHHHHDAACACGHDHHDHEEHHHHDAACACGHDHHDHEEHHHHDAACACEHDHHEHEEHHHHDEACGCGHDHHEHEEHHHHVPGHPADCQCELCRHGEEYCDICGESLANCTCKMPDADIEKAVFILENLGCANCAAKMEHKIKELPGVEYATITYATKQLRLSADNAAALLPDIQQICAAIEPDVKVIPRKKTVGKGATKVYTLENLGCANCAAKMEAKINALDGVTNATITYATKQLKVTGRDPDSLLPQFRDICQSIESDVQVIPRETRQKAAAQEPQVLSAKPEKKKMSAETKTLIGIIIGAALFVIGEIMERTLPPVYNIPVFVLAYIILGGRIVITAVRNLMKGQVFDENFLMSVATLAAFAIQDYPEAVGVMLFYRVGEYFEDRAVEKSRSQIMNAVDMRPEVVNLLVGDEVRVIDAEDAAIGDILLVRPGDRIPLDGVIVEGESRIDTSPVTGEPVPVKAGYGDEVVSGCVNTSGLLKMRVEKVLEESMVTRILDSVENAAASKPKIDRFITRFSRIYTPFVVGLAILTAVVPSLVTGDWYYWIYTAITFLVISCPCALVLSVPLAFFSGIGAGSKRGILFKGGVSIEGIKNIAAVVMDKTGTITEGNFVVQQAIPTSGVDEAKLLALAASCELTSTHPIGNSIVTAAEERGLSVERPASAREIAGKGIEAILSDSTVLCGNRSLLESQNVDLDGYKNDHYGTEVLLALDGKFIGYLVISDTIKADAVDAIAKIKRLGIRTAMLTGDAQESAEAVAKATGIDEVHAKLLPEDKLSELQAIRKAQGGVMFVGDGINDAPVLAGADVGAAMGSGADAAIEAADVVFMNSSVEAIPQAIEIGRKTSRIAWQNVVFALIIKALVMVLGLMGFANMWMAVFADTGVAILCVLNSIRILYKK